MQKRIFRIKGAEFFHDPVKKHTARKIIWAIVIILAGAVSGILLADRYLQCLQKQINRNNKVQNIQNKNSVPQAIAPAAENQKENK